MHILPIIYLEHLSDSQIAEYECSDKLWLPPRMFEYWVTHSEVGVPTILRLTNSVEQTAVGLAHMPHRNKNNDDTLYVPQWMYNLLECDDNVEITRFQPSMCTGLTIQPHTSDHIRAKDPQEYLRNAFEHYTCIMDGLTLPLWVIDDEATTGHMFLVNIAATKPAKDAEPLCIRNCELELELLAPLDLPPPAPAPVPVQEPEQEPPSEPATPGYVLGGAVDATKTKRELAAAAARKRFEAQQPAV